VTILPPRVYIRNHWSIGTNWSGWGQLCRRWSALGIYTSHRRGRNV